MPILLGPNLGAWCELLAVLGIGTSVAVALAAFVSRRVHPPSGNEPCGRPAR